MDTKQNHSEPIDVIDTAFGDGDFVLTNAGFGLRANVKVVEESGVRLVKDIQMLGVSLVSEDQLVDPQTRIGQTVDAPFYDPHQNLNLENDKPPRGSYGGAIQILDDFAFWKIDTNTNMDHPNRMLRTDFLPPDILSAELEQQLQAKLDALGISPELLYGDNRYSTAKAMEEMRQEEVQAVDASMYELGEETIVRCGAVVQQYLDQPLCGLFHSEQSQEAAQMIETLATKGVPLPRRDMFHALFPIQPLGAETHKFKKREFDYELIGGL